MRLLKVIVVGAVVLAALTPVAAFSLDRFFGQTVQPVVKSAPEAVSLNRAMYQKGDPVAEVYGVPTERKLRVLFVSSSKIVRPAEDPSITLLLVDKQHGDNPLQVKTVYFVAWRVVGGLLAVALAGLVVLLLLARRRRGRETVAARSDRLPTDDAPATPPAAA